MCALLCVSLGFVQNFCCRTNFSTQPFDSICLVTDNSLLLCVTGHTQSKGCIENQFCNYIFVCTKPRETHNNANKLIQFNLIKPSLICAPLTCTTALADGSG